MGKNVAGFLCPFSAERALRKRRHGGQAAVRTTGAPPRREVLRIALGLVKHVTWRIQRPPVATLVIRSTEFRTAECLRGRAAGHEIGFRRLSWADRR